MIKSPTTVLKGFILFRCHNLIQLWVTIFRSILETELTRYTNSQPYVLKVMTGEIEDDRTLR